MSSLTNLIPKIEGFQPIPNAVMIPFMETQSAALAFGFGLNYEYGKRTIRSMSNETFNSLTSEQIAEMSAQHSTVLLARFIKAVPQVMPAQTEIFKQYVEIEKAKVIQNVELAKWIVANAPSIIIEGSPGTDIITTPSPTPVFTPPPTIRDSRTPTISKSATFWVYTNSARPTTQKVQQFLAKAYPKDVTISNIRAGGSVIYKRTFQSKIYRVKYMFTYSYSAPFPLPSTISVTEENLANL